MYMKTKNIFKILSLALCIALGLSLVACTQKEDEFDEENPTASFVAIEPDALDTLENAFVLFGRESCQDCQEFYPYLAKASKEANVKIYYVDTENQDRDNAEDPITVAREKYLAAQYVPSLVYVNNGATVYSFYTEMYERYGTELVPNSEETATNKLNYIKEFLQDPQANGEEAEDDMDDVMAEDEALPELEDDISEEELS